MEPAHKPLSGWRAVAVLAAIGALVYLTTGRGPVSRQAIGGQAPEFRLPDLSGKEVALSDFRGKIVLVDFWATWCAPCEEELPDLIALHEKYKDKGFTVLGVDLDALGKKVVEPFVQRHKIPYPILLSGADAPPGYEVSGLPAAVLVDRKGRLVRSYLGSRTLSEFAVDVEAVLGP